MDHALPAEKHRTPNTKMLEAILLASAVLGRLPALGTWWALDDWGQLGRAAHLTPTAAGWPARILSQHWWWQLVVPLTGLNPTPQALVRMFLHAGAVLLVGRIGRKVGMSTAAWFTAAVVFAATPLAFTPVYWASGIQELGAAFFALLAVERWLGGTRRQMVAALFAALASFLAKESGLGLPVLFLAVLWWGENIKRKDRAFAWTMIMFTLLGAVIAGTLAMAHFATGPHEPYALGGLGVMLSNLGTMGWWLLSPGPLLASRITWLMGAAGAAFFLLWTLWAGFRMPTGRPIPAATLLAVLLVIGPALPLRAQLHPYLAYLAVAPLALALASLLPRIRLSRGFIFLLPLLAMTWSLLGMKVRLDNRNGLGFPADPVVRATSLSWAATNLIRSTISHTKQAKADSVVHLILYQEPSGASELENARRFGPSWVQESELFLACGGDIGPRMVAPPGTVIQWRNSLASSPSDALVLAATATGFKVWGTVSNALFYAALTDVGLGYFDRARLHLIGAAAINPATVNFVYDQGQMIVPLELAQKNLQPFIDWTVRQLDKGSSRFEIGGIQTMFFNLLSNCSGKSVAELTAGSQILIPGVDVPPMTREETH